MIEYLDSAVIKTQDLTAKEQLKKLIKVFGVKNLKLIKKAIRKNTNSIWNNSTFV